MLTTWDTIGRSPLSLLSVSVPLSTERMSMRLKLRKIRLTEGNVKCRHLKKFTRKGTLLPVYICLRPRTSSPPPLYTLYTCRQFKQGMGEGGELNQREG
jgi:hypothetical protein